MDLVIATLLMVASSLFFLLGDRERIKASKHRKIIWFYYRRIGEWRAWPYLLAGAVLLGVGVGYIVDQVRPWAGLLLGLAVLAPSVGLTYRHNRQIGLESNAPGQARQAPVV